MDKFKKLIEDMLKENKSNDEILAAVVEADAKKELVASDAAHLVYQMRKADEAKKALADAEKEDEEKEEEKEEEKRLNETIDKKVDERLKKININPTQSFGKAKEIKRFVNGEWKTLEAPAEVYVKGNEMLHAILREDVDTARGISKEIDQHNASQRKAAYDIAGVKAPTPTVSDVDARGGYAIPTEVDEMITQMIYAQSIVLANSKTDNVIMEDKIYPVMYGLEVDYVANQTTELTEKNPTFTNPTVNMERIGAYSSISNTIVRQKGADLMNAFMTAYASAYARFLDLHLVAGNVTGDADLQDGMIFDANTVQETTPIALANLTISDLSAMVTNISDETTNLRWIMNRKVAHKIGLLENTGGNYAFPQFVGGGTFAPFGIPALIDPKIPSTLDVGGDARTGGTDDALVLADMDKFVVGLAGDTRIDTSEHFFFTKDLLAIRAVKTAGWKNLISSTVTSGGVIRVQELTN